MLLEPVSADRIDDLVQLWNEEWGSSFPMREALMIQNVLGDPNLLEEGTRVAIDEDSNRVIGLVVSKQWREKRDGLDFGTESGWIHSLLVSGSFRRQGLGNRLLVLAEDALLNNGVRQVHLGNDFHRRMFPGVPETNPETMRWLERRGYVRQAEVMDLYRDDEKAEPEPLPEGNDGVIFRLAEESDAGELNAFLTRCFPGRWSYQTLHYWELGGTGREFVIAEREGEMIGFCRINDSHSPLLAQNIYWSPLFKEELGGIGPLGIDERFRGHGYGLAIVQAGIHFLHARGIRKTVIDTTAYEDFYGKLGYRPWKRYVRYQKLL